MLFIIAQISELLSERDSLSTTSMNLSQFNARSALQTEVIDKAANGCSDTLAFDENGELILASNGNPVIIEYGLPPNWKAAAWRLERKFPERWGPVRKTKLEIDNDQSSITVHFVDP